MRDDVTEHYDTHKLAGILQRLLASLATREEDEDGVEEEQEDEHDGYAEHDV